MGRVQPYIKNYQIMACPSDGRTLGQSNAWGQAVLLGHSYLEPGNAKYFKVSYGLNEWLDGAPGGTHNESPPVDSIAAISPRLHGPLRRCHRPVDERLGLPGVTASWRMWYRLLARLGRPHRMGGLGRRP